MVRAEENVGLAGIGSAAVGTVGPGGANDEVGLAVAVNIAAGDDAQPVLRLGAALATGDTNGDGLADILLGSFLADGPDDARYQAGEAYLLLGSPSLAGRRDLAQGEYDLALLAQDGDDQLGRYLAMGDLDGDQRDDLIVSAFRADGPGNEREDGGEVYAFFGASQLRGVVDLAATHPDLTIYAARAFDELGVSLAAGDLNGDGLRDLIVGAPRAGQEARHGQAYVFSGGPGLTGSRDVAQVQQDVTLQGTDSGDRFGAALAAADLDGDGLAEVIAGAERGDGPDNQRQDDGEVYVVRGSSALPATLEMAGGAYDAIVFGERGGDTSGASLATTDWDGDGHFDLLVSAPLADGPSDRSDSGAVYVIRGTSLLK